ncbi:MAG: EfeM/EfeO family lipoprotein [Chloroflexi bacterium]|nr:imelysin family protein [Anaerolineaceae bacterium]NMB89542.1 EfeM/EfeO family lipoprotein [Chloroflexota bacterium]
MRSNTRVFLFAGCLALALSSCSGPAPAVEVAPTGTAAPAAETRSVDLAPVKDYVVEHATAMQAGAEALQATAEAYYALIEAAGFDYQAAWEAHPQELADLAADAKDQWLETSTHYELNEGLIAGVPSLSHFDVLLDAGPSGEEAPDEALDWTLELPNGERLEKPGNYFHNLLEPSVWGTDERYTGAQVDLDGDGQLELGETLPEANVFLAASRGLAETSVEMLAAVNAWEPTTEDTFTALAIMIPTMNEYFEQWKLSAFVAGDEFEEAAFVGASRLFDIVNILNGLDLTYQNLSPLVVGTDAELDEQIRAGFTSLRSYVDDLYQRELQGERFSADQADLFGSEAQSRATALVGQVMQAAGLLNVTVAE